MDDGELWFLQTEIQTDLPLKTIRFFWRFEWVDFKIYCTADVIRSMNDMQRIKCVV